MQVATVLVTWPLWQRRADPPLLPAWDGMPGVDFGPWMLATALVVLLAPRLGVVAHGLTMVAAMVADQTRMQPEIVSGWFLLLGTLDSSSAALVARAHLLSLWFYSGWHKLISPGFYRQTAPWLWGSLLPDAPPQWAVTFGVGLALTEIALAIVALVPACRKWVAVVALLFHLGVLASLVALDWNVAVWPWNLMLALAGPALVATWRAGPLADWRLQPLWCRVAALGLWIVPAGYYLNLVDPYLAHCLYSSNVPRAYLHGAAGRVDLVLAPLEPLGVPLPPAPRLLEAYFDAVAQPGDRLILRDPRWWARYCNRSRLERQHPPDTPLPHDPRIP